MASSELFLVLCQERLRREILYCYNIHKHTGLDPFFLNSII